MSKKADYHSYIVNGLDETNTMEKLTISAIAGKVEIEEVEVQVDSCRYNPSAETYYCYTDCEPIDGRPSPFGLTAY
ncbi:MULTISPECIES: hypothetical protein [unclassified Clostridioides]|uniref:hypothetical protein n=1 Tax=unclassified Clostridioides TaxID=2635829 RepID=UPI001D0FC92C|nr:hypothetical protein [Clostridioides sp. ES-S-0171-01]MCC0687014.1 hypothetical protein [Clostridioides sp. ES-S-0056-01]MCC0714160.1 hypothetical protein [Clostridioides sp. ES-S-0077-01]UDN55659.1 hypothetical protein JJC02_05655 [Clostridioides sp. ES-S-0054-01]